MPTINMRSSANLIKGQGVGSCYTEQVNLVKKGLLPDFIVTENKRGKFDIVHYHTVNFEYFIERLFNRRHTQGVGYVHFLPATLEESLKLPWLFRKIFYKYVLAFYNSMDYLVTVNPYFIEKIKEHGVTRPKVCCIPNFVSSEKFHPISQNQLIDIRKKYGFTEEQFIVLGVGQLQTRKGVFDFIETAKLLPSIQFVWAGGFSFGKITEGYDEIRKIVKNPPRNVKFLGIVEREEMPDIYNMSNLMFLPSFEELFPMAILEAFCCKKPVLLRDVPLYEEILSDSYIKGKNPKEFAEQIANISSNEEDYANWCEKAWECHLRYTEEKALEQWDQFYRDVLDESKIMGTN